MKFGSAILNGGNVPMIRSGEDLPASGKGNEMFVNPAAGQLFAWDGSGWTAVGGGGGGGGTLQTVTTAGNTTNRNIIANSYAATAFSGFSTNYTVTDNDCNLSFNLSGGSLSVDLSGVTQIGKQIEIRVSAVSPFVINSLTIRHNPGGTINGRVSVKLAMLNECMILKYSGAGRWYILSPNIRMSQELYAASLASPLSSFPFPHRLADVPDTGNMRSANAAAAQLLAANPTNWVTIDATNVYLNFPAPLTFGAPVQFWVTATLKY